MPELKKRRLIAYLKQDEKTREKIDPHVLQWNNEVSRFPLHRFLVEHGIFSCREMDEILLRLEFDDPYEKQKWDRLPEGMEPLEMEAYGGMGEIYRLVDTTRNRFFALKIMREEVENEVVQKRFENEMKVIKALSHPNIVRYEGIFPIGTRAGICFEWIQGLNLEQFVRRYGPLSEWQALSLMIELARAIRYYASMGIIHRDIKPSNILLPLGEGARLSDFGLAKDTGVQHGITIGFVGTLSYSSPEQILGEKVDITTDLYSLGATMVFCLSGTTPFEGNYSKSVQEIQQGKRVPDLESLKISASTRTLLSKMMALEARDRYSSPHALLDALSKMKGWYLVSSDRKSGKTFLEEVCLYSLKSDEVFIRKIYDEFAVFAKKQGTLRVNERLVNAEEWHYVMNKDKLDISPDLSLYLVSGIAPASNPSLPAWELITHDTGERYRLELLSTRKLKLSKVQITTNAPSKGEIVITQQETLLPDSSRKAEGSESLREICVKEEIVAGRGEKNDWMILVPYEREEESDPNYRKNRVISRQHFGFRLSNGLLSIFDQKSTYGTFLDGAKLDPAKQYVIPDRKCSIMLGRKEEDGKIVHGVIIELSPLSPAKRGDAQQKTVQDLDIQKQNTL